jgi:hypothetical protein
MTIEQEGTDCIRRCGRPTRSGQSCRNTLRPAETACKTHATDHDLALADAFNRGHDAGFNLAKGIWREKSPNDQLLRAQDRTHKLEEQLRDRRVADHQRQYPGDQIIEINGKLGYRWSGDEPLSIGDRVVLPENWISQMKEGRGSWVGTVTALGSDYDGDMSLVLRRAPAAP